MSKKPSKDRASLCTFTFSDGRRCSSPRSGAKYDLCFFHLVKLRQRQLAEQAGQEVAAPFDTGFVTACDLNAAFTRLFSAVAQGLIKPKVASTLANIGQLLLRNQPLAKEEIFAAGGHRVWAKFVQNAVTPPGPEDHPDGEDSEEDSDPDTSDEQISGDDADSDDDSAPSGSESAASQASTPPSP
jgi:hypothetical protein